MDNASHVLYIYLPILSVHRSLLSNLKWKKKKEFDHYNFTIYDFMNLYRLRLLLLIYFLFRKYIIYKISCQFTFVMSYNQNQSICLKKNSIATWLITFNMYPSKYSYFGREIDWLCAAAAAAIVLDSRLIIDTYIHYISMNNLVSLTRQWTEVASMEGKNRSMVNQTNGMLIGE